MAEAYIGEIRLFAGNYPPGGWALCNGQAVRVAEYAALYNLIGNTFGGDQTVFNLPNLMERCVLGSGKGTNLSNDYPFASSGGANSVALTIAAVPAHGHSFSVANVVATNAAPGPELGFGNVDAAYSFYIDTAQKTTGTIKFSPDAVSNAGQNASHENRMPSLALSYIICLDGFFPHVDD